MKHFPNFLKRQAGFTMIEMLLALMIGSLCIVLCTKLLGIIRIKNMQNYQSEDAIAIRQLQLLFAIGENYEIHGATLFMDYEGKQIRLEQYDHALVRRSGFVVFLQNVDQIEWVQQGRCILLQWKRKQAVSNAVVGCE